MSLFPDCEHASDAAPLKTFTQLHDEYMAITGECPAPHDCPVCAERKDERTKTLLRATATGA